MSTNPQAANVFLSLTYDGHHHGTEEAVLYSVPGSYTQRFIAYRLGYVDKAVAVKLRGASKTRMCFSQAMITHG